MLIAYGKSPDDCIKCPACQGGHIHHDTVTIFDRKAEDAPSYALVVERGGCVSNITGARAEQDNPSSRRHGVAIRFWCEECDTISELAVEQHKGSTRLRWRAAEGHYSPNTKCDEPPLLSIIRRFGQ